MASVELLSSTDNPEYFNMLNKDESATTLVDVSSGHPNQLNTSLESSNGTVLCKWVMRLSNPKWKSMAVHKPIIIPYM